MNVFLSYASETRPAVEDVAAALRAEGDDVFFDEDALDSGRSYNNRIRTAIRDCDLFIFFISPYSVKKGRYTLSELLCARNRWSNPSGRILPVMLTDTPMEELPAVLKSVKILKPEGNLAAEISERVRGLGRSLAIEAAESDSIQMAPGPPKPMLGRASLLEELTEALLEDSNRPVSLTGLGGAGKTALASELCHRLAVRFPGGVLWSKLGTQPSLTSELSVWAGVVCPSLDLTRYDSDEDRATALRAELARRGRMLCVVDDVWPVEPAGLLREALPAGCRIVVTSRSLEMAKAGRGRPFRVEPLDAEASRQLFLALAELTPGDKFEADIDAIIEACEGLPLAIEIAAGLIDDPEDVTEIARRLGERSEVEVLRLLASGERAECREGSVEACFALSYDGLDEEDRRRFRALGAFASGSLTQAAIEHVWRTDEHDRDPVESLRIFRRRHLLTRDRATGDIVLQNLLRSYAATLLDRAGEAEDVGERHKNYYLSRLEAWSWQELEAVWPQIVKVWTWLLAFDLDGALQFAFDIGGFQGRRGHDAERVEWLTALHQARSDAAQSAAGARLCNALGYALLNLGRDEEPRGLFESALEAATKLGETDLAISARVGLADSFLNPGADERARELYEAALDEARKAGSSWQGSCLARIANLHWRHRRYDEAVSIGEQAMALHRQSGDEERLASALINLGVVYRDLGRSEDQHALATEAAEIFERRGNLPGLHGALEGQALALHDLGRLDEALDVHRRALEGAQRIGDRQSEAETLGQIAWIYADQGLHEESLQLCEDALAVQQELGNRMCAARRLNDLAARLEERDEIDGALDALGHALKVQVEIGNLADQVATKTQMACLLENHRRFDAARACFHEGISLAQGGGVPESMSGCVAECHRGLARIIRAENGDMGQALASLRDGLALSKTRKDVPFRALYHHLLAELLESLDRLDDALEHCKAELGELSDEEVEARFRLLMQAGRLAWRIESFEEAESLHRAALEAALNEQLLAADPACRIEALHGLADCLHMQDRSAEAFSALEEAIEEATQKDLTEWQASCEELVVWVLLGQDRGDDAVARLNRALELVGEDFEWRCRLLVRRGWILDRLGSPEAALGSYQEAMRLAAAEAIEGAGSWQEEAVEGASRNLVESGRVDEARGLLVESLAAAESNNATAPELIWRLRQLAQHYRAVEQNPDLAIPLYQRLLGHCPGDDAKTRLELLGAVSESRLQEGRIGRALEACIEYAQAALDSNDLELQTNCFFHAEKVLEASVGAAKERPGSTRTLEMLRDKLLAIVGELSKSLS